MRFFLFSFFLIALALLGGNISGPILAASDDTNVVITECQKRTGLGEASCITLIKKYMSVERCQSYTDLSAKECEEKIAELKNDPKFQTKPSEKVTLPVEKQETKQPISSPEGRSVGATLRERILEAKREKEQRFLLIQEETQAMIEYLRQENQETQALEMALQEFIQKKEAVLLAYDQYQSVAEALHSDEPFALEGPQQMVLRVLQDATEYYRSTVLALLQKSITEAQ